MSNVGSSSIESWRLAPSTAQPMGMPCRSVRTDHFHPSLALSVGFLPVPSPPAGLLCSDPSTATSERSRPMILSYPSLASAAIALNTPASIHSSRRSRTVVSETLLPHSRSASSHEHPVTRRTSITSKQSRLSARGRWQPSGWSSTASGMSGSIPAQTASPTSGSSVRTSYGGTSTWSFGSWDSTPIVSGPLQRPVDGHQLQGTDSLLTGLSPIRAASKCRVRAAGLGALPSHNDDSRSDLGWPAMAGASQLPAQPRPCRSVTWRMR